PCHGRRLVDRRPGRQMPRKSRDGEVPADPHRAWAELGPMILDDRRVLQRHPRLVALGRDLDVDPAGRAAEFPRRCEMTGRRARRDGPARIPLELVPSAQPQVALDRQKPSRDTLLAGQCVPQVIDISVVKPCQRDRARWSPVLLKIAHRARDKPQYAGDVDLHAVLLVGLRHRISAHTYISQYFYINRPSQRGAASRRRRRRTSAPCLALSMDPLINRRETNVGAHESMTPSGRPEGHALAARSRSTRSVTSRATATAPSTSLSPFTIAKLISTYSLRPLLCTARVSVGRPSSFRVPFVIAASKPLQCAPRRCSGMISSMLCPSVSSTE